jgi:selenocysteine lyase/cysteine desulfurase
VAPNSEGLVTAEDFARSVKPNTRLVVLNHASNVSGALAPAKHIKEAIGDIPLLLDTAQTAGAMPLDDLGSWLDILTFTGHKGLLGPTGTGGLWLRPGLELRSLAVGGSGSRSESLTHPDFLPDALEAGTANTHGLAGLAAGVEFLLETGLDKIRDHEMQLARMFIEGLSNLPGVTILGPGPDKPRVATVSVILEKWSSSDLAMNLEKKYGILTRAGLHCAPLAHQHLNSFPVGTTRFSFGFFNTKDEVTIGVKAIVDLNNLTTKSPQEGL